MKGPREQASGLKGQATRHHDAKATTGHRPPARRTASRLPATCGSQSNGLGHKARSDFSAGPEIMRKESIVFRPDALNSQRKRSALTQQLYSAAKRV